MCKSNKLKNNQGFSLLEVIVALAILTMAFIGIAQSFPYGMSVNESAKGKTRASYLAQAKIEELYSKGYDNIATGTSESKVVLSTNPESYLNDFKRTTEVDYIDGSFNEVSNDTGLKKISVEVFYIDPVTKKEDDVSIYTLISKR